MLLRRTILCLSFLSVALLQNVFSDSEIELPKCNLAISQPCKNNSSLCVLHEHVQDGFVDCPDGSDEDCGEGWFICEDFSGCFPSDQVQDGEPDCHDESDEACNEDQHECLCGFPRCIDKSKVMDGHLDCKEGSDEIHIMKDSYICPDDLSISQELTRDKRHIEKNPRKAENAGVTTNYYEIKEGVTLPVGVLSSTVDSFVNKGTTSEYFTQVTGKTVDGKYAQIISHTSRTFFALPTRLNSDQVHGLVSSVIKTLVSNGFTQTLVSRIYHTHIDGSYAQLLETERKGLGVTPTVTNYITILQGEELHGTFLSHPGESLATIKFSHLEGSLNPDPVAGEIVTVTGTHGQFIREGHEDHTTFGVFTGSYVKDDKTYVFFFGNSALPQQDMTKTLENPGKLVMKQGNEHGNVILDMEKNIEVIMPSKMKMMNMASKKELFIGEGMVDGHKMDGVFIADSEGFDIKGAHKESGGDIKMLTVTIGQPSTMVDKSHMATRLVDEIEMLSQKDIGEFNNNIENEIEFAALKARKIDGSDNEIAFDFIQPSRPQHNVPTFIISEPQQDIGELLKRQMLDRQNFFTPQLPKDQDHESNILKDIKAKLNIDSNFGQSDFQTVTYYGFAEFTTTIADTVVVFSPTSGIPPIHKAVSNTLTGRIAPSINREIQNSNLITATKTVPDFSTVSTEVFNNVDLYPSGLVSSIGGTIINDEMTTLFTTLVYGTYIDDQYAQVVRSTSSIYYLVPESTSSIIAPTLVSSILPASTTTSSVLGSKVDILGSIFDDIADNTIGRAVSGDSSDQKIQNDILEKEVEKDQILSPVNTLNQFSPSLDTTEIISPTSTTNDFFDLFTLIDDKVTERFEEEKSEFTTEASIQDTTDSTDITLESSLNPDDVVSAVFYPRTYYTTYTYFTTYYRLGTSSIASSLETVTNVVSDQNQLVEDRVVTPIISNQPVTYYTTYTYWSTILRGNSSITTSSKETISNIVSLSGQDQVISTIPVAPLTTTESPLFSFPLVEDKMQDNEIINAFTTYYTTYTYFTTSIKDGTTLVTSVLETSSSIATGTIAPSPTTTVRPIATDLTDSVVDEAITEGDLESSITTVEPANEGIFDEVGLFGLFNTNEDAEISRTGLLSTIRRSTVVDHVTTVFSTNVYGSYVNGLYLEIQSTISEVIEPTTTLAVNALNLRENEQTVNVLTVNAGTIVENEITTYYTTQILAASVDGTQSEIIRSTSRLEGKTDVNIDHNPTRTGVVREIAGSLIHGTKTTYYHSTVLGTLVGGIYAQKVESTSRLISGPSLTFDPIPDIGEPIKSVSSIKTEPLEPSSDSTIHPTSTETVTESLEQDSITTATTGKNRLSFPIRISSKRRTGLFNFIQRTSTFEKPDLLTKGIIAPVLSKVEATEIITKPKEIPTTTPKTTTPKQRESPFRFGSNNSKPRRFRFKSKETKKPEKLKEKKEEKPAKVKVPAQPTPPIAKEHEKEEGKDSKQPFRQFRFGSSAGSSSGTRSSLPFIRKQSQSKKPKPLEILQENAKKEEKQTTTTIAPKTRPSRVEKPKPFSFLNRSPQRERRPNRNRPNRANRLQSRRRSILSRLNREESVIEPVFVLPELNINEEQGDLIIIPFTSDDIISRKKRDSTFGVRTTNRGSKRFSRTQEVQNTDDVAPKIPSRRIPVRRVRAKFARPTPKEAKVPTPQVKASSRKRTARISTPRTETMHRLSRPGKSRNTLPFRTRASRRLTQPERKPQPPPPPQPQQQLRGFRRPSTTNRLKVSNRFNPTKDKSPTTTPRRRPSVFLPSRGRLDQRELLRQRLSEKAKEEEKKRISKEKIEIEQETKIENPVGIASELTVTRDFPVTTAIPLIENGNTVTKQVITASKSVQVIPSSLITKTNVNGEVKYLLSSSVGKMKITHLFIEPIISDHVIYKTAFISGRETSVPEITPITMYSVITVTTTKTDDIGDLLKLLVLQQQQQQNPLLAALGLGQPSTTVSLSTTVYETTVTSLFSAVVPIILRGKAVEKTIVDTQTKVITTSEIITQTVMLQGGSPLLNSNPLGQFLPLLFNNQGRSVREVENERIQRSVNNADLQEDILNKEQLLTSLVEPTFNEIEFSPGQQFTPSLEYFQTDESDQENLNENAKHFLWQGPPEHAPLRRKVRSAQRGRRFRDRGRRIVAGRKVQDGAKQQVLSEEEKAISVTTPDELVPVTYFTTFTFYTTLLDAAGTQFVQSSKETITQIARNANVQLVDLQKTALPADKTEIPVQEKFALRDAIIPGKPRPVPEPIFNEPRPPHGPIIRHEQHQRPAPQRVRVRPQFNRNFRRQRTQVELVQPITVLPQFKIDKISTEPIDIDIKKLEISKVNDNSRQQSNDQNDFRRVRITVTKKRPLFSSNVADLVDKSPINDGGKPRIVITKRLPHPQPTAVASPIDPFMGTVDTLYTVYSYLYSVYEGPTPLSVSTRLITVSNSVEPTLVKVPPKYQSIDIISNFYTIEEGKSTVKLGVRATTGYATEIHLASATLAEINPDTPSPETEFATALISDIPKINNNKRTGANLESSLTEPESIKITETPTTVLHSDDTTLTDSNKELRDFPKSDPKPIITRRPDRIISSNRGTAKFANTKTNLPLETRRRIVRPVKVKPTSSRHRFRQRRPRPPFRPVQQPIEKDVTKLVELEPSKDEADKPDESSFNEEHSTSIPLHEETFSLFDIFEETEKDSTIQDEISKTVSNKATPDIFSIFETESPKIQESFDATTTTIGTTESSTPPLSTTLRTTRKPLRRDDIPIIRDKSERTHGLPTKDFKLRFTTTPKPNLTEEISDQFPEDIYNLEEEYQTDDFAQATDPKDPENSGIKEQGISESHPTPVSVQTTGIYTTFTTTTLLPILGGEQSLTLTVVTSSLVSSTSDVEATATQAITGTESKAIFDDFFAAVIPDEVLPTETTQSTKENALEAKGRAVHGNGAPFQSLGARITTGVRQNLATKVMDNGVHVIVADGTKPLFQATIKDDMFFRDNIGEAITLPPSTLSNKMVLVNSESANPNVQLNTKTYLTTHTFVKTLNPLTNPKTVTSEEIVTQVIVTESPDVTRTKIATSPTYTFLETKTYFTTYTYYSTYADGPHSFVDSSTIVSSEVVVGTNRVVGPFPAISVTDIWHQLQDLNSVQYLATKTYFTTSTYLTTILEGENTVTSSRIEITSNIVTEPYTSVQDLGFSSNTQSAFDNSHESVAYVSVAKNKYKQLRTLFATYTHFTTMTDGIVHSREVTKTQVITSMVSTTAVPASLIIDSAKTEIHPTASFIPDIESTVVLLDPSFYTTATVNVPTDHLDSSKVMLIKGSSKPIKISDPKATMHVSEGSESDTKVVQDSTTKATLLVGSSVVSDESIRFDFINSFISDVLENSEFLASSELPLIETTNVLSPTSSYDISTSTIATSSVLRNSDGSDVALSPGDMVVIVTKPSGQMVTLPHPGIESTQTLDDLVSDLIRSQDPEASQVSIDELKLNPEDVESSSSVSEAQNPNEDTFDSPPVRLGVSSTSSSGTSSSSSSGSGTVATTSEGNDGGDGVSALAFGLAPMLTAVAGILGGSLVGSVTGGGGPGVRRKAEQPLLPKNTIVSADQEPVFIPVGGLGASVSSSYEQSTITPEHGFIPLSRPDPHDQVDQFQGHINTRPILPKPGIHFGSPGNFVSSMEKFGPTFRPPLTTEAGFTAMTKGFSPTQVSVISGEQTIFFGGQTADARPVKIGTHVTSEVRPVPVPTKISDESRNQPIQPSEGQFPGGFDIFDSLFPSIHNRDQERSQDSTIPIVGSAPENIPEYVDPLEAEISVTRVIDETPTRPLDPTVDDSISTSHIQTSGKDEGHRSILIGSDGSTTQLITNTRTNQVLKETKTYYQLPESTLVLSTEVIRKTLPVRVLVTTIVGHTTRINEVKPTVFNTNEFIRGDLPSDIFGNDQTEPVFSDLGYPEVHTNEANLGYDEENEISRVIESNSPDQDLRHLQKYTVCSLVCSQNELCKIEGQAETCICKPGYGRKADNRACIKTSAYQMDVILEKYSNSQLSFSPELKDKSHPDTQFLVTEVESGVEKALMDSTVGENYHSNIVLEFDEIPQGQESRLIVAKVKIDIADESNTGEAFFAGNFFSPKEKVDQSSLKVAMEESLGSSNYSLGGSDLFVKKESAILASKDFDECQSPEHNDCHQDAQCINIVGSFTCKCNRHFKDQSDTSEPGRLCLEHKSCSECNYHGRCDEAANGRTSCHCDDWFSGERCQINMKVMLIAVVTVGAFLLLLMIIFMMFCCFRTRKDHQNSFLRPKNVGMPATLDRRAMIHDSSSESSEDISRIPSGMEVKVHKPMQPTFTVDRKSNRGSSHDRSLGTNMAIPPVVIPRVKGYPAPKRPHVLEYSGGRYIPSDAKEKTKISPQAVLVDLLEGPVNKEDSKDKISLAKSASVHSLGGSSKYMPSRSKSREELHQEIAQHLRRHHHNPYHLEEEPIRPIENMRSRSNSRQRHHHHDDKEVFRARSGDRLDRSSHDLTSEFGGSSFQFGNKTVSEVRSYDETTVRPPIRSLRGESFRSRDLSSQQISEGPPTNAERDGASTLVYPPMQLYRPIRESDSMSDLTANPRYPPRDFFE